MSLGNSQLYKLFAAQFAERQGLLIYQATSFKTGRTTADAYIVSPAERDRFIADFNTQAPLVQKKMARDFILAVLSLIASSLILGPIFPDFLHQAEMILFFVHLVAVFIIENRRLEELWNVPMRAMIGRVPAPTELIGKKPWLKPFSELDGKELGLGLIFGAFGFVSLIGITARPRAATVSDMTYYFALAPLALFALIGVFSLVEVIWRMLGGAKEKA
ncbi:MAG: hypothetical protein ACKOPM_12530 [Novosphingobium sp.]